MSPPGGSRFYARLTDAWKGAGGKITFRRRYSIYAAPEYAEPGVHFVHQGLVRHPGIFNTGIAYMAPFWYVDSVSVFGESSIRAEAFDAQAEDTAEARLI